MIASGSTRTSISVDVGELLRRSSFGANPDTERWVTLARFRRLTPDIDIEDDLTARLTAASGKKGFVRR